MSADIKLVRWPERDRDDFLRLTGALSRIRTAAQRGGDLVSPAIPAGPQDASDADHARALLDQSIARDRAFGEHAALFANPAWHIMLSLFVANDEGRTITMRELALCCGALPAAATRWLTILEQSDLIARAGEGHDPTIRLTRGGKAILTRCLHAL